jgi:hypothetical protein
MQASIALSFARSTGVLLLALVAAAPAAASVVSVTLNPATIAGGTGGSTTGTVAIGQPAPAGGRVINLASSNTDLAASTERVVVPEGATTATFTVGTNALYRAYSGLAFNVTITARDPADNGSASAVLHVTAQAIPGPFTGSTVSTDARATAGRMCGGSFGTGNAKERGILYSCNFPQAGQFSVCRFQQECSFGCQTQAAPSLNRQDVCRTAPPFPIAVNPELLEGGRRANGAVFIDAPANSLTSANVSVSPGGEVSPLGSFPIPEGTTTAPFDLDTFEVGVPAFLQFRVDLSLNPLERFAQDYLAVVPSPGREAAAGPLAVFSVDTTPISVVQGNPSIGQVILNGVAPAGGAVVSLSSSSGAASVPATVKVDAGQSATVFGVTTAGVTQVTPVTITASLGGVSRSTSMNVSPFVFSTGAPTLTDLTVNPTAVAAGTRSIGRVRISIPAPDPSDGPVTVALTSSNEAAVVVSRRVSVGFGGTFADFRIRTFAVAQSTVVTLTATFNGVSRSATLTVNPSGAPPPPPPPPPTVTLTALSVNPTTVAGGNPSTGTVTLSAAAPTGGVVVSLSDNSTAASSPASVTVPGGATTASFAIATTAVTTTTSATFTATLGSNSRTAVLTVSPAPPTQTSTLTVTATGRSGERITSTPAGINVAVGSTGSASFTTGTSITLRVSNGREAIWSGACSSGGNKRKTCTFTLNANASVTANVR